MIKSRMLCSLALACLLLSLGGQPAWAQESSPAQAAPPAAGETSLERGKRLLLHYPGIKDLRDNTVVFQDGGTLPYDDGRAKSFEQRLEQADIKDHFAQDYPALAPITPPAKDFDPGRFRNDALLRRLYGHDKAEIQANLVEVQWMPRHGGRKLMFNKNQNAAAQLAKVSAELDKLPERCLKYIVNPDSTFEYRPIEGTNRLSPHSYGIAIDLEVKYTIYWLWDKKYHYVNQIPQEVVDIFEKHGFVWGGRWYHYDTMHFEYRPEMFERVL